MKLIYGTANFQKNYGILKSNISKSQIIDILQFLRKKKIFNLDTALSYKVENDDNFYNYKKFKIYSKLRKIPKNIKNKNDLETFIFSEVNKDLKKYKVKKLDGYYIHDINDVKLHGKDLNLVFNKLKKKNKIKSIGLSFYNIENEYNLLSKFKADLIQLPFNVLTFNKKIIKILKKIKRKNIKILARSIFLQGLILKKNNKIPSKLKHIKKALMLIEKNGYNTIEKKILLTLCSIRQSKVFDGIIFSCNNKKEIKNFLRLLKKNEYKNINFIKDIDLKFQNIDPRKW